MSGGWPLPVLGFSELPSLLSHCAACGAPHACLRHALVFCPASLRLRSLLPEAGAPLQAVGPDLFLQVLFAEGAAQAARAAYVAFVGRCVLGAAPRARYSSSSSSERTPLERQSPAARGRPASSI